MPLELHFTDHELLTPAALQRASIEIARARAMVEAAGAARPPHPSKARARSPRPQTTKRKYGTGSCPP